VAGEEPRSRRRCPAPPASAARARIEPKSRKSSCCAKCGGLPAIVEAAGIEPASADAPVRTSTSVVRALDSTAGRGRTPYRRPSHPLVSRFGRLALPPRRARCWRRYPSHGPDSERRRYLTELGGECEIVLRTCLCAGGFTRPTGDLGLQLCRRTDHVETRSPPYVVHIVAAVWRLVPPPSPCAIGRD
jgi:hypothetical protein